MKNLSFHHYSDFESSKNPKPSVSINGDGNEETAEKILKELDKHPIASHHIHVDTTELSNGKHIGFHLSMSFKTRSDAKKAYNRSYAECA